MSIIPFAVGTGAGAPSRAGLLAPPSLSELEAALEECLQFTGTVVPAISGM